MCTCAAALALTSLLGGIDIGRSIPPNGFSRVATAAELVEPRAETKAGKARAGLRAA
jgi:hypothetical protein